MVKYTHHLSYLWECNSMIWAYDHPNIFPTYSCDHPNRDQMYPIVGLAVCKCMSIGMDDAPPRTPQCVLPALWTQIICTAMLSVWWHMALGVSTRLGNCPKRILIITFPRCRVCCRVNTNKTGIQRCCTSHAMHMPAMLHHMLGLWGAAAMPRAKIYIGRIISTHQGR